LPKSLSESLEALEKTDFFDEFIDQKLLTAIKAIGKVNILTKKAFNTWVDFWALSHNCTS